MIEGILIAAKVVDVETCYIYMRDEYPEIIALLRAELDKVRAAGLAAHVEIQLRRGAGAYICGEESAMIESIEANAACHAIARPMLPNRAFSGARRWSIMSRRCTGSATLSRMAPTGSTRRASPTIRARAAIRFPGVLPVPA